MLRGLTASGSIPRHVFGCESNALARQIRFCRMLGVNGQRHTAMTAFMQCQRCLRGEEAHHRVKSETMDIAVCDTCAEEARRLGLATKVFYGFEHVPDGDKLPARIRDRAR